MNRAGSLLVTLSLVLATTAPPARAEVPAAAIPDRARELAREGRAYHAAGNYAAAITAFTEAYVLAPSPALLFNLAQAYRLSGQCARAAWMYRRYLASAPPRATRELARRQLRHVAECDRDERQVRAVPPAPGRHDEPPGQQPPRAPDIVSRGPMLRMPGRIESRLGIGLALGGSLLGAGAVYFALDASDASASVSAAYQRGASAHDVGALDARGRRSATLATALGVGGGVMLASGAVLYLLGRRAHLEHLVIAPTTHGAAVRLGGRF